MTEELKKELEAKYVSKLKDLKSDDDIEMSHGSADTTLTDLLEELGFKEVVKAYDDLEKWYA